MSSFLLFIYLQLLDVLTTLAVIKHGGEESNPFLVWLLSSHPQALELILAKLVMVIVVCLIIGVAKWYDKYPKYFLPAVNTFGMALVVWNISNLL